MRSEIVKVKTLTHAYRAKDLLSAHHVTVYILPTNQEFSRSGCGYSILITGDLSLAYALLERAGITTRRTSDT